MQFQIIVLFALVAAVFAVPVPDPAAEAVAAPGCTATGEQECF